MATPIDDSVPSYSTGYSSSSLSQEPEALSVPKVEQEYNFVEQPDQDYFCPVTLEFLLEPHQTDCCGQHISEEAVQRITKDGKPCPMCNEKQFTTHKDKYFMRTTINKLKVHCPYKKNGCEWTGELGHQNLHSTACSKRPWKCPYCEFESPHDVGRDDHTPNCPNYPLPCPNQCEIGTIPRHDAKRHLLDCPLQLVECEFAGAGCDMKVLRRDLATHMTESAQHHLMSATLLNLQLTRELHQKMEEKDKQITELQSQLKDLATTQDRKFQELDAEIKQQDCRITVNEQEIAAVQLKIKNEALLSDGFICHDLYLYNFTGHQAEGGRGEWISETIFVDGWEFNLVVFTNGRSSGDGSGTHLSGYLYKPHTKSCIEGELVLQLLNQLGDYGHYEGEKTIITTYRFDVYFSATFFPLDQLGHCAETNIQYLKDDMLHFRLFLKIEAANWY